MTDLVPAIRVPVLLYHSICPPGQSVTDRWQVTCRDLAEDMEAIQASGRQPVTASRYAAWLRGANDHIQRPILITFDDGFADFTDVALPILNTYGYPATLFVTTGWLGRRSMLSGQAVRDLAGTRTEIGAHSVTHPHLDAIASARARREMTASRQTLEDLTGRPVTSMAYPHGSHSRRIRTFAVEAGYLTAHAVKNAISHSSDDPYAVARYTVEARTSRAQMRAVVNGDGPLAWRRERLRTRGYRVVRTLRSRVEL